MSIQYEIYARRECHEALTRVGTITASDGDTVRDVAKREHGEDWLEMIAVPQDGIAWVIRED